ncbi:MAG: radical SAM protein [Deltaproteobacteria bacterium]|nr:radical SAM protein [Deltaproteobacteria bacterium]
MKSSVVPQPLDHPMDEGLIPDPFPRRITLELSASCNLSCVMCPRRYGSLSAGLMEWSLFERIVEELSVHPVEAVVPFFRGESLLHPNFMEMITLLRQKNRADIQLATNALLLTPSLAEALLELGINFISFSLDALSRETYETIRRGGDFHRAMENVHTFLRLRKHMRHCPTTVQVSATEGPHNAHEIPAFVRYWKQRVDRVRIYPCHSEEGRYGRLSRPELRRPAALREPCRKPFMDLVIYADGRVALCNHDWDRKGDDAIGSVQEKPIQEIWKSPAYRDIRNKHLDRRWNDLEPCRHCDHWQGTLSGEADTVGTLIES